MTTWGERSFFAFCGLQKVQGHSCRGSAFEQLPAYPMLGCRRCVTTRGFLNTQSWVSSPGADLLGETFGEQLVSAIAAPPCPWGGIALL